MKRGILGLELGLCAAVTFLALTPAAAVTYNVSDNEGSFSVTGTITTDGHVGVLSAADILGWSLTITENSQKVLLNNSDSTLSISGSDLTATATTLSFDFGDTDRHTGGDFEIKEKGAHAPYLELLSAYIDGSWQGAYEVLVDKDKQQEEFANCIEMIATASQTPLPAALPLFGAGLGALGMIARRRKRKASPAIPAQWRGGRKPPRALCLQRRDTVPTASQLVAQPRPERNPAKWKPVRRKIARQTIKSRV